MTGPNLGLYCVHLTAESAPVRAISNHAPLKRMNTYVLEAKGRTGRTELACGNHLMPQTKGARCAPDGWIYFGVLSATLGFGVLIFFWLEICVLVI